MAKFKVGDRVVIITEALMGQEGESGKRDHPQAQ